MDARPIDDTELVAAALGGDAASFGVLLERHRADMRAVAVALLGYGPAAEDAVQDAMLVALEQLPTLADPAAAGAWLRAVVRNTCRMQLRRARPTVPLQWDVEASDGGTEQVIEQHALRDWIWHAVGQLSEPLQTVLLLRHFGRRWTYSEIAAICEIPVGTVRSRLNEARRQLGGLLLTAAESAHDDAAALTRRRGERLRDLLDSPGHGTLAGAVADLAHPDLVTAGWWGAIGPSFIRLTEPGASAAPGGMDRTPRDGQQMLGLMLRMDAEAGVVERVVEINASQRVTVMECDLVNPPWDPTHCPPSVLWVMAMHEERVNHLRLYHPGPATPA
jgi:RNA polymerase sigma-70 factor (ECF subfamily)